MSKRLTVQDSEQKPIYDIVIEKDFQALAQELNRLALIGRKYCIVTDSHVGPLHQKALREAVSSCVSEVHVFTFPAGEASKNLEVVKQLYAYLIEARFDRSDCLLALGGGVVGDLTGYTAATYLRGIPFVQLPTTLLAQSDSSIGGKTGVDFDGYKNMVGAFYMPRLVYMNLETLKTLPERVYLEGMGEVVKHGCIRDVSFYQWLKENCGKIRERRLDTLEQMDEWNCRIKRQVVQEDPTETGIRALLNFGHTLGHAIEKQKSEELYHGECVAIGMLAAAWLSVQRGTLSKQELLDLQELLQAFSLPTRVTGLHLEAALLAAKSDKKVKAGAIRFILLQGLGSAVIEEGLSWEELRRALTYISTDEETVPNAKKS